MSEPDEPIPDFMTETGPPSVPNSRPGVLIDTIPVKGKRCVRMTLRSPDGSQCAVMTVSQAMDLVESLIRVSASIDPDILPAP